ncbi:MAG: preprotein translocase subunit YajC [Pseudomonadota bacterium]
MFITPAYAQGAGASGGSILELLFPLILVGGIMWFLVLRPQRNQQKARATMLENIRRNDTVITGGGVIGKVTKVIDDDELEVQIATDVKVKILRAMIADVRVKGEPATKSAGGKAKADKAAAKTKE